MLTDNLVTNIHDFKSTKKAKDSTFPFVIIIFRELLFKKWFIKVSKIIYNFLLVFSFVGIIYLISINSYDAAVEMPVSLFLLFHLELLVILCLPHMVYKCCVSVLSNPDTYYLLQGVFQLDKRFKLKFTPITYFNVVILCFALSFYTVTNPLISSISVSIISILYILPFQVALSLVVCVIELHRIKIDNVLQNISKKREILEKRFCNRSIESLNFFDDDSKYCKIEMNDLISPVRSSNDVADMESSAEVIEQEISELTVNYYEIHSMCSRISKSVGIYLLYFFIFGFMYAFITIFAIYVEIYPTKGIWGFVVVGLVSIMELGVALASTNETGHLVVTELASYMMALRYSNEKYNVASEVTMVLSMISHVKLQICFFGNFALRSSMLFALVGSLVASIIPALIENQQNR